MKTRKPETRAQQHIEAIFNGTGTITSCCQDLREIAYALQTLGMPAGSQMLGMIEEVRAQAQTIAHAIGAYVSDQAEGRLYLKPPEDTLVLMEEEHRRL